MKPANERKTVTLWCDIYPNADRRNLFFNGYAPQQPPNYPNKRLWASIEIPGDEELWPELFKGQDLNVVSIKVQE